MFEGFTVYMNRLSEADAKGEAPELNGLGQQYGSSSGNEDEMPMMSNANLGGAWYGFQAYVKAPMMLSMLGGIVGDTAVWRAQAEFARAWRFKHPTPWDYMFSMNRSLGRNLDWFWHAWLFATESSNGCIVNVAASNTGAEVSVRQDGDMAAPVILLVEFSDTIPAVVHTGDTMVQQGVSTSQRYTFPVEVWFAGARTFQARIDTGGRRIARITLDPDGRIPDSDPADNVWPRSHPGSGEPRP
jgi:hypothetical protein